MRHLNTPLFLVYTAALLCYASCKKNSPNKQASLSITSVSVSSGAYNTSVTINGTGFSTNLSADIVTFNSKAATVTAATTTTLMATVPKGAGTGNISVAVGNAKAVGPVFNYTYTITVTTLAGSERDTALDGTGANAGFHGMWGLASDSHGNIYAPDPQSNTIRKITPDGVVTTFAGSGKLGYADGKGRAATFGTPEAIVADNADNLYVTDCYYKFIRKITPDGTVTTLVDARADFLNPEALTIDENNNLYLYDYQTIYKITPAGVVSKFIAASGSVALSGMVRDKKGVFYLAAGQGIATVSETTSGFQPFAGGNTIGLQDGPALQALFNYPNGLAFDKDGNLIVADTDNWMIREVTTDGNVVSLLGRFHSGYPTVDGPASVATFYAPFGITFDPSGNLFIQDQSHKLRKAAFE